MNTQNKKILITGGGTGIGFAIASAFSGNGNQLILVGRREEKLKKAVSLLENASYIVADVSKESDLEKLPAQIRSEAGGLDILVNNAGVANRHDLTATEGIYEKAKQEIETNYLSPLRLTEKLLSLLGQSSEAAVINIESIVSYLPNALIPTYSASKAALHSYSQSLRLVLEKADSRIKVFEVFPPYVDTEMTRGVDKEKLSPDQIAADILNALQRNEYAVRSGLTRDLYQLFRRSPEEALLQLN